MPGQDFPLIKRTVRSLPPSGVTGSLHWARRRADGTRVKARSAARGSGRARWVLSTFYPAWLRPVSYCKWLKVRMSYLTFRTRTERPKMRPDWHLQLRLVTKANLK